MLEGKHGYPAQRCMEILLALGNCYDAKKMIPVGSAHTLPAIHCVFDAGAAFLAEIVAMGGRCLPYTTVNPQIMDLKS